MAEEKKSKFAAVVVTVVVVAIATSLTLLIARRYDEYKARQKPAGSLSTVSVEMAKLTKSTVPKTLESRGVIESSHIYYLVDQEKIPME